MRDFCANLKKVLALVLAFACAFTMFAGAAFTDQADIKVDTDVVDTLVSLGVVEGFEDGSFQPNGTVTRAQMAKMIYVLRTGKSDASAYNDDKTSFTDIGSHWARGYIKYCQSLGIIAGKSNTKFVPNEKVSAQEAAKMLLVTLGYDANKAGLVGTNWAAKTNALADENGLLEDVNTSFTGPCPRQYAAQLIYNTLDANTVVWRDDAYTNVNVIGGKNQTVGQKYMGLLDTDDSILLSVKEDSKGTFTVKSATKNAKNEYVVTTFTKVGKDYTDLLGQKVDVLAKATDKVYGIYATSANDVAVKSTVGDLDKLKVDTLKIDGTEYDIASGAQVYTTSLGVTSGALHGGVAYNTGAGFTGMDTANTVYAVSNDEDEKIDLFVVIPAHVAKVTNVSSSSVVLSGIGSIDTDDYVAYEGLKKNDYVLYIKDNDGTAYKDTLSKVDVVNATVDGVKNGDEFRINGTYYKAGTGVSKTPKAGDKVEAALYGSRFYSMDINAATSVEDMLVVYAAGARMGGVATGAEAKVVFSDGTKSTINVTKIVDPKDSSFEYDVDQNVAIKLANASGANYAGTETTVSGKVTAYAADLVVGALYTYEKDGSDYKLTPVTADNDAGFDDINAVNTTKKYEKSNDRATLGGNRIDDTATIFVVEKLGTINDANADAKVITGKSLSSWSNAWGSFTQTATNTNNGVKTVMAAVVADTSNGYGVNDDTYGIVNSDVVRVYGADGKRYYQFKLWNGSEDETVYTKNADLDKGDVVTFDEDDKVGDIRVLKTTVVNGTVGALLGVDGKYVTVAATPYTSAVSKEYKVTDDTSVLFIEDDKAVAGTVADLNSYKATETSNDNVFVPNMKYILNTANTEFEMIIVDVRGYLSALDNDITAKSGTTGYNAADKTLTISANTTATAIGALFDNVLTAKRVDDSHVLLVSTKGDELTITVTGGKVTA